MVRHVGVPAGEVQIGDRILVGRHKRPVNAVRLHPRGVTIGLDWDKCHLMFVPHGFQFVLDRADSSP